MLQLPPSCANRLLWSTITTVNIISYTAMAIHSDSLSSLPPPERLVAPQSSSPNEDSVERALRPRELKEYIGQHRVREQLELFITAAKNRGEALDHVLLFAHQTGRASGRERVVHNV